MLQSRAMARPAVERPPVRGRAGDYQDRELPEGHEIIDGVLVRKAMPGYAHGSFQLWFGQVLAPYWGPGDGEGPRRPGGKTSGKPGGWLFSSEADIELAPGQRYLPDVAGWRMDRVTPEDLRDIPIRVAPDWVCEVLSPSTAATDLGAKQRHYHAAGVTHYWLIDPYHTPTAEPPTADPPTADRLVGTQQLTVLEREGAGYRTLLATTLDEPVRIEPFTAASLDLGGLLDLLPATDPGGQKPG